AAKEELMAFKHVMCVWLAALAIVMVGAATAHAQNGAIAGVVKDASGAVIPGVTVEAASPVLIERVRSVVTGSQGQYKIVDRRPGGSGCRRSDGRRQRHDHSRQQDRRLCLSVERHAAQRRLVQHQRSTEYGRGAGNQLPGWRELGGKPRRWRHREPRTQRWRE